jgi:hypothetical protein
MNAKTERESEQRTEVSGKKINANSLQINRYSCPYAKLIKHYVIKCGVNSALGIGKLHASAVLPKN